MSTSWSLYTSHIQKEEMNNKSSWRPLDINEDILRGQVAFRARKD